MFKKDKVIANQKAMINNRDILIGDMEEQALVLHNENKELRNENEDLENLFKRIQKIATANSYNNEKVFLNKIRELIHDYQSKN